MVPAVAAVAQDPDLGGILLDPRIHPVQVKDIPVDRPKPALMVEIPQSVALDLVKSTGGNARKSSGKALGSESPASRLT